MAPIIQRMGSVEKKKALQQSAGIKLVVALSTIVLGLFLPRLLGPQNPLAVAGLVLLLVGVVAWYWGLGQYCVSKGYSGVLAIAGIFGIFGLLLILVLTDKWRLEAPPVMSEGVYPRQPGNVTTIV